jgi:hypothetical protein
LSEKKEDCNDLEDLDDLLDKQWEMQDQIHKKCKIKDDPKEKLKKWNEKYEKK